MLVVMDLERLQAYGEYGRRPTTVSLAFKPIASHSDYFAQAVGDGRTSLLYSRCASHAVVPLRAASMSRETKFLHDF